MCLFKKKKVGELKSQFGFHLNEQSQLITLLSGYVNKNKLTFIFIYLFLNETGSSHGDWGTLLISEPSAHYLSERKELAAAKHAYRMHRDLAWS